MLDYVFLAFFLQEHHLINCRSGSRESTNSHDFGTDIGWWFNLYCHKRSCFFHVWHLQTLIKLEVSRHLFSRHRHGNFPHLQASQHTPDQSCVSCQFSRWFFHGFFFAFNLLFLTCDHASLYPDELPVHQLIPWLKKRHHLYITPIYSNITSA